MFTGMIQNKGTITRVAPGPLGMKVGIQTGFSDLIRGESIAVNGVCLTVTENSPGTLQPGEALFFLSQETLEKTNLHSLQPHSTVNLERALLASERLSGHIVQGHVDGQGRLHRITLQGESHLLEIALPLSLSRYCVEKGSICIDGVSLTLNFLRSPSPSETATDECLAGITLIPHSWTHTRFSDLKAGDSVNIEVDVLAKYVEKLCQPYYPKL